MELVALVLEKGKEEVEDPTICVLGIGKGNESVTIVGCANEIEGGGYVGMVSSLLLGFVSITQKLFVIYKREKKT